MVTDVPKNLHKHSSINLHQKGELVILKLESEGGELSKRQKLHRHSHNQTLMAMILELDSQRSGR